MHTGSLLLFHQSSLSLACLTDPSAPKTRGNKFALALFDNSPNSYARLFITTEQENSTFTIHTRFAITGFVDYSFQNCFVETPPGSGLYSCTATANSGKFTLIDLDPGNYSVQTNGSTNIDDRQKGMFIETEDPTHELTVTVDMYDAYRNSGSYMAINCVEFPTASDYQYFVFSSDSTSESLGGSQFLITPCENNTSISVRPSQPISHPDWVLPSIASTYPSSTTGQDVTNYGRIFNRFDTLLFSTIGDLTGSIVISDKPLSVIVHSCGSLAGAHRCSYLVEQVLPHPTYGDLFFIFTTMVSRRQTYRIGSVTDGAQVTINCNCSNDTPSGNNSVALQSSEPGVLTATVNRGQYVQCITPEKACCIQSKQPVTVMNYLDDALIYIPPATSFLNDYSAFYGPVTYCILPTTIFDNSVEDQNRFTINDEVYIPDEYEPISCYVNGSSELCAYGFVNDELLQYSQFSLSIEYKNIGSGAFWAYQVDKFSRFGYPLPFEMEPVGCEFSLVVCQTYNSCAYNSASL